MSATYNLGKINEEQNSKLVKFSTPGIYSKLKLTSCLMTDKHIVFKFEDAATNQYMDTRIFLNTDLDWTGKTRKPEEVTKTETQIIAKLIEIAKSVGDMKDLEKAEGTYSTLLVKLFQYCEKKASTGLVNIKVVMQNETSQYTKMANYGFIEKYEAGKEPTLFFTNSEKDQKLDVRPSSPTIEKKSSALDLEMSSFSHGMSDAVEAPAASGAISDDMPF